MAKADETHIHSIFSNLILNAKDALEEQEAEGRGRRAGRKEINVTVETLGEEGKRQLKIEVRTTAPVFPNKALPRSLSRFILPSQPLGQDWV